MMIFKEACVVRLINTIIKKAKKVALKEKEGSTYKG
jgi:hypothetical protein